MHSVTIATNMAGRGTDILLGGDAEAMARLHLETALRKASEQDEAKLSSVSRLKKD